MSHLIVVQARRHATSIIVRIQDLLDRDPAQNLQIHQRQKVGLVILVLGDLSVIVDRKLHV